MDCENVQLQLLQLETLDPKCEPAIIAEHLRRCPICAKKEHLLRQLEEAWRRQSAALDAEITRRGPFGRHPHHHAATAVDDPLLCDIISVLAAHQIHQKWIKPSNNFIGQGAAMRRLLSVWIALLFASGITPAQDPTKLPNDFSLKSRFDEFGLAARQQGARDTCIFFATTGVADFEYAKSAGKGRKPFAEDYLVWAAREACKETSADFNRAVKGLEQLGLCDEALMPYGEKDDAERVPSDAARTAAKQHAHRWQVHTVPPSDLKDPRYLNIKGILVSGHPLAAAFSWPKKAEGPALLKVVPASELGIVHAVVIVGYTDDASKPGGGVFHIRNSWGARWGTDGYGAISYAYARAYLRDAFWLHYGAPNSEKPLVRFEAERLKVTRAEHCEVSKQDMKPFNPHLWSAGHHLYAKAKKGAIVEVSFKLASPGKYRLRALATRAPDYGKIRFALDGTNIERTFDLFCVDVAPAGSLELGTHSLQEGPHTLRITVVDKNSLSTNYFFGIDTIDLCAPPPTGNKGPG